MSLTAALHASLAFVAAEVLAKDTQLEVVVLDGRLKVREAKLPQKVSTLLKQVMVLSYNQKWCLNHYI